MSDFDAKKYSAAEIALLLIFAAGLLIAYWMVKARSDITMILKDAPASGVKVALPQGKGWESDSQWRFVRNAYYISSREGSDEAGTTKVTIGYLVAAAAPAQSQIEQRANQLGGRVSQSKDVKCKNAVVTLGQIEFAQRGPTVIYGVVKAAAGRSVSIELVDSGANSQEWLWMMAEKMAANISVTKNVLLEDGSKIVSGIKAGGLEGWLRQQGRQSYYMVSRGQDNAVGFVVGLNSRIQAESAMNIRLVSASFVQDAIGEENVFQTDGQLGRWVWVSNQLASSGGRGGRVEAYLNEKGQLSVRLFGRIMEFTTPGPAALPDAVIEAAFLQMAANNIRTAIIDVITANGSIVPCTVSIEKGKSSDVAYVGHIEYLDGTGKTQSITFNKKFHIISAELGPKAILDIRVSSKDEVLTNFPVWSDYIQSLDGLLKGDAAQQTDSKEVYL